MVSTDDMDLDSLMDLLDDNEPFKDELHPSASKMDPEKLQSGITISDVATRNKISLCDIDLFSSEHGGETLGGDGKQLLGAVQPQKQRSEVLKAGFREGLLDPKKVENPKKAEVYERHPFDREESAIFCFGELGSSDEETEREEKEFLTETGRMVKKEIEAKLHPASHQERKRAETPMWTSKSFSVPTKKSQSEESLIVDSYSGIRIVNPLVSFSMLQQRMRERKMVKMSFIQNSLKGGDIEGDWVTMGVLIGKVPPKTSKNGKPYSIWRMSDLHDPEKPVSVFLFRAAHTDHWKTTVGTVLGILNPSILPDRNKSGEVSISVDHPGKFMVMGKSKDLGFCKSKKKDGFICNTAVNKLQCEYCTYHVRNEYKKFSAKRSELQAPGRDVSLKNKLLKGGSGIFYGGQSFHAAPAKRPSDTSRARDELLLSNLGLKRKASEVLDLVEKEKSVKKLAELYGPKILPAANSNSEFINTQLAKPTLGSRNLLEHLMKEKPTNVITLKGLLKMRDSQMSARGVLQKHKIDMMVAKSAPPQLGRGLQHGQEFSLDFSPSAVSSKTQNYAKMRAIQKIKERGQLEQKDPNSVKVSVKAKDKVKSVLEKSFEEDQSKYNVVEAKPSVVKSVLGSIDLNSEKVKAILKRGSSHLYEVDTAEMQKEAAYFNALEKKEQMEEKMAATKEIVCDVVSCLKCKYTAHTSAERCKREQHPLKCHKALKRFFACKDCKRRSFGFTKLPKVACRGCHGSNFERTSMMKARSGPKLESETLNICGEESYFLNSL